ncbi:MAG TPA: LuxR C-terminal-related transcriptional regulator [Stenomitos sp.]
MSDPVFGSIDGTRLLIGLQQVNAIAKTISGCLNPEEIARQVTDGLVEKFGCAFARIWLVEPDRSMLGLVASSGLYTQIDGSFAKVPMGAFKVGKIAQNQISFLSNQLPEEPWVKDRDWAIAHQLQGFAGYPLVSKDQSIGVLAVFSQQTMGSEFLEVLQSLCATTTVALEAALHYQREQQVWKAEQGNRSVKEKDSLSDQLAQILRTTPLTLVGTERSLNTALMILFLGMAEIVCQFPCIYSRLTYATDQVTWEVMVASPAIENPSTFAEVQFAAVCLGGTLWVQTDAHPGILQVILSVPYAQQLSSPPLVVQCRSPILQLAMTRLTYLAGFSVAAISDSSLVLITDDLELAATAERVLWVGEAKINLEQVRSTLDLDVSLVNFRQTVETVQNGRPWGVELRVTEKPMLLSDREREIMSLLTQGFRDRDIASRLIISESTVKFHMNNVLNKLKARTRFQALYHAISQGWLE